jgi:glycerol-3-phosphate dehydrogenase (NAD(P)+)
LKNILAIAAGVLDGLKMGANCRSMLITLGLKEMVRFGVFMGAQEETFLGLAGIGDVLATCGSSESRNYRVGFRLAQGDGIDQILAGLGSTAEGVLTAQSVFRFAQEHGISMPLTQSVCQLIQGEGSAQEIVQGLTR